VRINFHIAQFCFLIKGIPEQMNMPFRQIGGIRKSLINNIYKHPSMTFAQTDGSFFAHSRKGAVAALLRYPDNRVQGFRYPLEKIVSSTEAEWASIYFGFELAKRNGQGFVALENDCLGVIRNIIFNSPGTHEYARYYHEKIWETVNDTEWCGIRWIPRELNQADKLLR